MVSRQPSRTGPYGMRRTAQPPDLLDDLPDVPLPPLPTTLVLTVPLLIRPVVGSPNERARGLVVVGELAAARPAAGSRPDSPSGSPTSAR